MMTVEEYAIDVNRSIDVILGKCKELGFNISNKDDVLSEEQVIDLDNADYESYEEEELEDKAEEIVSNMKSTFDTIKVQKLKKKKNIVILQ